MNRFERMDGPFPAILRDIEDRDDRLFFPRDVLSSLFSLLYFIRFLLVSILKALRIRRFFRDSFLSTIM